MVSMSLTDLPPVAEEALGLLGPVADRTRAQIVYMLCRHGRMNVGDIARHFRMSRPAVSHHLRVLKESGLVECEKVGQAIFYSVDASRLIQALHGLAESIAACRPGT